MLSFENKFPPLNLAELEWELQALVHYRREYELRLEQYLKGPGGFKGGDTQLAAESGEAILAVLKSQPQAAKPNEARDVAANVKSLWDKPLKVTPVIFAMPEMGQAQRVGDLVDSSKRVGFDLAGNHVTRQWPWVKDGTALLVWDPGHTGVIKDGRQLFGSRTWWIFFRDGYEALSVLDDNHDGVLTGWELDGLVVWVDENRNGVCDDGEIKTLGTLNIKALRYSHAPVEGHPDHIVYSPQGVLYNDGTSGPSYDIILHQKP